MNIITKIRGIRFYNKHPEAREEGVSLEQFLEMLESNYKEYKRLGKAYHNNLRQRLQEVLERTQCTGKRDDRLYKKSPLREKPLLILINRKPVPRQNKRTERAR